MIVEVKTLAPPPPPPIKYIVVTLSREEANDLVRYFTCRNDTWASATTKQLHDLLRYPNQV